MATTTNYGWTTPNDTDLVKDGAAAIRTLGSSVDTTTKALNPSTTLGDIEYRSATANTNTRLAIGSTGNVLTVAGGVPTWAAPAGGSITWTLLNSGGTALTGATNITVSGISAKQLLVLVDSASASAYSSISVRPNNDTGENYTMYGISNFIGSTYDAGSFSTRQNFSNNTRLFLGQAPADAAAYITGSAFFDSADTTGWKRFVSMGGGGGADATGGHTQQLLQGVWEGSAAITSITINSSSGNFDGGTVYVLGGN
jgi:hypothetical protein